MIEFFWDLICDFECPQLFFALLAVMVLSGILIIFSTRSIFTKFFIVTGEIFQIYLEYLILMFCVFLSFPRTVYSEYCDGEVVFEYTSEHFITLIILIPIFYLLILFPYKVTRFLYNKCYRYRKISERWIIPSRIISLMTFLIYSVIIIYYFIESTGKFYAIVLVIHTIIFILITRRFFRNKKSCGDYTEYTSIMKVLSVVINITSGVMAFIGVRLGGVITGEVAVFFPYVINFLLYRRLYKKNGLSEWWTFPAIIISIGAFLIYWYGLTEVFI